MDEDAGAAPSPDAVADVVFFAAAEVDAGGMAEGEVFHGVRLLFPVMLPVSVRFLKGRRCPVRVLSCRVRMADDLLKRLFKQFTGCFVQHVNLMAGEYSKI